MKMYRNVPDEELVALLHKEDYAAFEAIYERYWGLLFNHAARMLHDQAEAEDVVQDVFTMLWQKRQELSFQHTLPAFLYTAVRYGVLNKIDRQKTREYYATALQRLAVPVAAPADSSLLEQELAAGIEAELALLPEKMREIFLLSRMHHYSYQEISGKLKITANTVKKQISNALRILRTKLRSFF